MFILVFHHPSAFVYTVGIMEMEAKQYRTNILVTTMGKQAYQHT
jgi:hypothetical protein